MGEFDFYANAPANSPLSYQSLQTRRKIAEALLSKRTNLPFPKNLGEGLTYASERLANAYGDRQELARLEEAQRAYDVQGERDAQRASGMYGTDERRSDTGVPQVSSVDTQAIGTPVASDIPLPPPRPIYDRSQKLAELQNDPATAQRFMATVAGETNDPAEQGIVAGTILDRSTARDIPVAQALETYQGRRNDPGYYPQQTLDRGMRMLQSPQGFAGVANAIQPTLRGADPGGAALGFTPTGNASGGVAQRGIASGRYGNAGQIRPGGETFVTQETPRQLARLQAARFPAGGPDMGGPDLGGPDLGGPDTAQGPPGASGDVRNAIAQEIVGKSSAGAPNAQVASLGGGGPLGNAGAASAVIPPILPPAAPSEQVVPPTGNPPIVVPNITPRPQVAQVQPPISPVSPANPPFSPRTVPLSDTEPPKQTPMSNNERIARFQMIRAQNSGDPGRTAMWQDVVGQLAAQRAFLDKQNEEMWKARTGRTTTDVAAAQAASRQREVLEAKGELPGPSQPAAPDPNIGTPQSQQRKGYPDVPPRPPEIPPIKWAEQWAPILQKRTEAVAAAPSKFNSMIEAIDEARNHPGKDIGTGLGGAYARGVQGTEAYNFGTRIERLKNKTFLQGYDQIRGAGAITEKEGTKAEQAQAALDPNQSKESLDKALNNFENQIRVDLELVQRRMNMPVTAWKVPGGVSPDLGERDGNMEYIGGNPAVPASWRRVR